MLAPGKVLCVFRSDTLVSVIITSGNTIFTFCNYSFLQKWFMHTDASFIQEIDYFNDFQHALANIKDIFRDRSIENW